MSLQGSSYKTNSFQPSLSVAQIQQRFNWTKSFWVFWNAAKQFKQNTKVMLVHMDEKWFFAIAVRKNNKHVPALAVCPAPNTVQHKSHIEKVMGLCTTGFLPFNNDIEKGGVSIKIDFERAGRMEKATRDTYRRVYDENGKYTMPQIPQNQLRKKGEYYFRPLEVTGSNCGDTKTPKFSLKQYFSNSLFPKLERAVQVASQQNDNAKVLVRFQWDGAGPHVNKELTTYLDSEFTSRGWMFVPQPSQSPLTNTKDACIFPALSRRVTAAQGLSKGSLALASDEIWKYASDAFHHLPLETIARAYATHHQIVNAIYQDCGRDDFTRDKKALHVGSRLHFLPHHEGQSSVPNGVFSIESLDTIAHDEIEKRKLRYDTPDVTALEPEKWLNQQELAVIAEHLPIDSAVYSDYENAILHLHNTL